ncbi:MAG: hypothetical protein ABFC38_08350 [Methanospirillum sp.]
MRPEAPDSSLPGRLRELHTRLPLAGGRPNALLPDDRILSLAAVLRDTPQAAPALSLEEWREFLDLLRPHGIHALLADRLSAWPEDGRPPAEVMDFLKRQHLVAAARSLRAGRCRFRPGSIVRPSTANRRRGCGGRALPLRTMQDCCLPASF